MVLGVIIIWIVICGSIFTFNHVIKKLKARVDELEKENKTIAELLLESTKRQASLRDMVVELYPEEVKNEIKKAWEEAGLS
jgi:hypothetical protein